MYFRVLLVLAVAIALPWASATEEERNFKVLKFHPKTPSINNLLASRDEVDSATEEERALKIFKFHPKTPSINNLLASRDEVDVRGLGSFIKNKVLPVVKVVVPAVLQEGAKFLLNRAAAKNGREEEEEERSFKSFLNGAKNLALGAVGSILGREEEERKLKSFNLKAFEANAIHTTGREEEERSLKSIFKKIGSVALKVAPLAVGAATLLGRDEEERKIFSIKDFEKKAIYTTGREEERGFKSFLKKAAGVALKAAPIALAAHFLGREEEEERSLKSVLGKIANVGLKLAGPVVTLGTKIFGREEEEERSLKSVFKKIGSVVAKVAPLAIGAATLIGREE